MSYFADDTTIKEAPTPYAANHDLIADLQRRLAICEAQLSAKDAEIAALHQTLRVGLAGKQNPKKPIRRAS